MKKNKKIIKENGKTFYRESDNLYIRTHDENYEGKRTNYRRCLNCGKLVSKQWQGTKNCCEKAFFFKSLKR